MFKTVMKPGAIALGFFFLLSTCTFATNFESLCSEYIKKWPNLSKEIEEFHYLTSHSGYTNAARHQSALKEVMKYATSILDAHGVQYKIEKVTKATTGEIEVFRFLETGKSYFNTQAAELAKKYPGTKLIYDPYTLTLFGAEAYFSKKHGLVSIGHDAVLNGRYTDSYLHELIHLDTEFKIKNRKPPLLAGELRLVNGELFSKVLSNKYGTTIAIDEMKAFSHSMYMTALDLSKAVESKNEKLIKENLQKLAETYRSHHGIAQQFDDLLKRLIEKGKLDITWNGDIATIKQSSYTATANNGVWTYKEIPDGVELALPVPTKTAEAVLQKIKAIHALNEKILHALNDFKKSISIDFEERAIVAESDIPALLKKARVPRILTLAENH